MNNNLIRLPILCANLLLFLPIASEARETRKEAPIEYRRHAPESGTSRTRFGVGFSTITSSGTAGATSLSGLIEFTNTDALHTFLSLPSTSPFNIGITLLYKRTISQDHGSGFHVGGGFGFGSVNVGTTTNLIIDFAAMGGFHFEVPGASRINIHLDGGPYLRVASGVGSSTSFQITSLSPALGLSALYFF